MMKFLSAEDIIANSGNKKAIGNVVTVSVLNELIKSEYYILDFPNYWPSIDESILNVSCLTYPLYKIFDIKLIYDSEEFLIELTNLTKQDIEELCNNSTKNNYHNCEDYKRSLNITSNLICGKSTYIPTGEIIESKLNHQIIADIDLMQEFKKIKEGDLLIFNNVGIFADDLQSLEESDNFKFSIGNVKNKDTKEDDFIRTGSSLDLNCCHYNIIQVYIEYGIYTVDLVNCLDQKKLKLQWAGTRNPQLTETSNYKEVLKDLNKQELIGFSAILKELIKTNQTTTNNKKEKTNMNVNLKGNLVVKTQEGFFTYEDGQIKRELMPLDNVSDCKIIEKFELTKGDIITLDNNIHVVDIVHQEQQGYTVINFTTREKKQISCIIQDGMTNGFLVYDNPLTYLKKEGDIRTILAGVSSNTGKIMIQMSIDEHDSNMKMADIMSKLLEKLDK